MQKNSDEWKMLMTFAPYDSGVVYDLNRFKPAMREIVRVLIKQGFMYERSRGDQNLYGLTDKGREVV